MHTIDAKTKNSQDPPSQKNRRITARVELPREVQRIESLPWRAEAAVYLIAGGLFSQADDLLRCSDPDRAWQAVACPDDHSHFHQIIVPTCKLPYCPLCARSRSADLARQYIPLVQDALNLSPASHRLRHITLTTPYSIHHSQIDRLADSIWRKTINCFEQIFGVKQRNWKEKNIGVLGGWEFGEDGHKLHIHALVLSPWVDHEALVEAWKLATDGICQIAHIRGVKDLEYGVKEVTKYATKLTALPARIVPALHTVLSGKRRIRAYGVFYGKLADVESIPQTCPICQANLVVVSLLNLRTGNNFANRNAWEITELRNLSGIPPPVQLEMLPTKDFLYD